MDKCAFDFGKRRCYALNVKKCEGCRFFKTEEELKAGREKATDRLMTLDRKFLNDINRKYYGGRSRFTDDRRGES
jgi:hypothetical protein